MISKILNDDNVVIKILGDTWYVWYPLDKIINLQEVNELLTFFDIEMSALNLDSEYKVSSIDLENNQISEQIINLINDHALNLKNRLD